MSWDALVEPLLLRRAESLSASVGEELRPAVGRELALARQRLRASRALHHRGELAEAVRLATSALDRAVRAAELAHGGDAGSVLLAVGLPTDLRGVALRAREVAGADEGSLDAELGGEAEELLARLGRACGHLQRGLRGACIGVDGLRAMRRRRLVAVALFAAMAVVLLVRAALPSRGIEVSGSSSTHRDFPAAYAFDRNPHTEWLISDDQRGAIELRLTPPRHLSAVRILNGHNRGSNDRAAREFRLSLHANERQLVMVGGELPGIDPDPSWVEVPVSGEGVTRVRLEVLSWYGRGGGIAEIRLVEP